MKINPVKPTVEIVTASKRLIDELIQMDTHNRTKKHRHVDYLRKEIREGRFTLTNQGIGVTASGYICDGGHRLQAIKLEDYPPVQFILIRGLPDSSQKYVDQHAKRTMADTLTLFFDQTISSHLTAVLNVTIKVRTSWTITKPSPDEIIGEFQEKEEQIARMHGIEKYRDLPAPVFAALLDGFYESKDDRVLFFMSQVISGEMLQAGDPALTLRNWLSQTHGASGGSVVQRERYSKTTSALRAYMEGRRISRLYAADV